MRALEDQKNKKVSYLITTSIDVTGAPSGDATVVTASASQQTVLHKDSEKYFHLLGNTWAAVTTRFCSRHLSRAEHSSRG